MGYETRLYIGEVYNDMPMNKENSHFYFSVFAMLELCKVGHLITGNEENRTPIFFYATDGNTKITEDWCGDTLYAYPIALVKKILKRKIKEDYARYIWAYELLISMTKKRKNKHSKTPTHCFLFGH